MATTVSQASAQQLPRLAADYLPNEREPVKRRIDSVDLLRGIVMVIMMLDHTRDFVHNAWVQFDALDPERTNVALFFTRWITHYCAPTFVFLAGTGAYFQFMRGKRKNELSHFLVTRGLWLVVLEFTAVRFFVTFNVQPSFFGMMQVIWAIGISMFCLAGLIYLPERVLITFGLLMVALHNLLDRFRVAFGPGAPPPGLGSKIWMILHQPGGFQLAGVRSPVVLVLYPLIPWIGVMALGYAFGALYQMDHAQRKRWLIRIGGSAIALFIIIRAINIYGDPNRWSVQSRGFIYTVLSFLNTTKYPPSLLFLLMTLGPAILALAFFESSSTMLTGLRKFFVTFGRVPLFFYLLQWPTAHLISLLLHWIFGKPYHWLFQTPVDWFTNLPQGIGFNLGVVYLSWIVGVLLLYPLCSWFAGVKQRRRDWWLSYL
ncbi:MAG: hypothetical protein C5B55_13860 [Blastocatellia bacterium]|nr:MAG: hypothetical protein C5B55_13860 [Blastocatellia bacterium]